MKKICICLLAILSTSAICASAQTKGDMFVGGNLGISTTSLIIEGESSTGLNFNIAPEFGYFVADNLKIGASISYGIESADYATHTLSVLPNIAYYVKVCNNFYYTPGLELGFAAGFSEDISMPGFGLGVNLGSFELRPTEKFGISINLLSLSYVVLTYNDKDYGVRFNTNAVNFNLGISPSIGVKCYF